MRTASSPYAFDSVSFTLPRQLDVVLQSGSLMWYELPHPVLSCVCRFFQTTPVDLVDAGLFKALAIAFFAEPSREVGHVLLCMLLGARNARGHLWHLAHSMEFKGARNSVRHVSRVGLRLRTMRPVPAVQIPAAETPAPQIPVAQTPLEQSTHANEVSSVRTGREAPDVEMLELRNVKPASVTSTVSAPAQPAQLPGGGVCAATHSPSQHPPYIRADCDRNLSSDGQR